MRHSEVVKMYENNVELVRRYADIAQDMKDLIILDTRNMTQMNDAIKSNQFCPFLRIDKRANLQDIKEGINAV